MKIKSRLASLLVVLPWVLILSACSQEEAAVEQSTEERHELEAQIAEYIHLFSYQDPFNYVMRYTGGDPVRLNV